MARGRFISNTLGGSKKFSRLATDTHRLAYVLLVTMTDVEGRVEAEPQLLKGYAYTLLDWTNAEVQAALEDMHRVGLIQLYRIGDDQYAQVQDFDKHNKVRKDREADSKIPAPPESATNTKGRTPGGLREGSGSKPSQVQVQVQVEEEVEATPPTPPTPDRHAQEQAEEDLEKAQRVPPRGSDKLQALRQRHPTVWEELGKASTDRGWKPQQFRAIALSVYELADRYGEASTRQAVLDMVMAGDRVYSPAGWLKHRLESPRDVPPGERVYEDVDGGDLLGIGTLNGNWGPS